MDRKLSQVGSLKELANFLISCIEISHFTMKKFMRPSSLSTAETSPLINASANPKSASVAACEKIYVVHYQLQNVANIYEHGTYHIRDAYLPVKSRVMHS